ncbi:MAG: TolC family protein [Muribaculaceae bacterium]|nr:TolC family protein [Muribaculaceae bacterium]
MSKPLSPIYILVALVYAFVIPGILAQTQPLVTPGEKGPEILNRFQQRFHVMDSVLNDSQNDRFYFETFDSVFFEFRQAERIPEVDREVSARISEMKSHTGLEFRGQAYIRPGSGISYDPDDPLVAYNAKLQAEINWNIFNSSAYKRRSKAKAFEIQGELNQLNFVKTDIDEQILFQKQFIRYKYFSRLLSVINLHIENVRLLMESQLYLLEQGKISGEDLLKLINENTELERQLVSIQADSAVIEMPAPQSMAYVSRIDTAGIFRSIKENNLELKKLGLRRELLGVQRNNTDYVQTMDLLPFVRYSYYNRPYVNNTYNVDVGLSFRIPLSAEIRKKRRVYTAQQDVVDYEATLIESETTNGIFLVLHDLEIYNENIRGELGRMKSLREFIKMRTTSYYNVDGDYSRINRLMEYNAYLQAWERLLEYTYRRDIALLDLQSFLLTEPVSKYIEFEEIN